MRQTHGYKLINPASHSWLTTAVNEQSTLLIFYYCYFLLQENIAFLVPWVVGCMTFMALEAMAMVYSNILRDHVNKVSLKEHSLYNSIRFESKISS